ncbi:MAG: hypothetical protein JSU86_07130 [Phycisphaerales bacterium]|nr:MAG: hypothetical protein JSU86_07130 [Phycisphaerales bacterium]
MGMAHLPHRLETGVKRAAICHEAGWGPAAVRTGYVIDVLLGFIHALLDRCRGEKDSEPVFSGPERSPTDVYVQVLRDLQGRQQESFCTFESVNGLEFFFQVSGRELAVGNCSLPLGTAEVGKELTRHGIAVPDGFAVQEDRTYQGNRVVTFECEPMSPVDWAALIDSIMRKVHRFSADYRVKGWVSQAE